MPVLSAPLRLLRTTDTLGYPATPLAASHLCAPFAIFSLQGMGLMLTPGMNSQGSGICITGPRQPTKRSLDSTQLDGDGNGNGNGNSLTRLDNPRIARMRQLAKLLARLSYRPGPGPGQFQRAYARQRNETPPRNAARETPQASAARFRSPASPSSHFHTLENDAARADTRHVRRIRHVSTRENVPDLRDAPIDSA
ncbi:uncharacterized protein Triagg1_5403 [Trichoderma aggressivum f. europaeum]|uniref:Uncharacterized protein n=1 Tax=Trichoderma aggressivum f. europaeum TaxID=173218 RepID=A0AAE1M0A8_9HYPO|nr:hypothetical protein Triagg1_5403 [Trichoderma aggressivum f. europaeum]